jgi:hypothetical protein
MAGRPGKGYRYSSDSGGGVGIMDIVGGFSDVGSAQSALDAAKSEAAKQAATDAGSAAFLGTSGALTNTPRFKMPDVGKAPGKLATFFNPRGASEWAREVRSALGDQVQLQNEFTLRSSLADIDNRFRLGQIDRNHANQLAEEAVRAKNLKDQARNAFYYGQKIDPNEIQPTDSEAVRNYITFNNPTRNLAIEAENVRDRYKAIDEGLRADISAGVLTSPEGRANTITGLVRAPLLAGQAEDRLQRSQDFEQGVKWPSENQLAVDTFELNKRRQGFAERQPEVVSPGAMVIPRARLEGLTEPYTVPLQARPSPFSQMLGAETYQGFNPVTLGGQTFYAAPANRVSQTGKPQTQAQTTPQAVAQSAAQTQPKPVRAPIQSTPQQPGTFLGIPYRQPTNSPPGGDPWRSVLQSVYGFVEPNTRDQLERNFGNYIWSR